VFDRSKAENHRPGFEVLVDCACVQKAEVPQDSLRGVLEAVGGEPRFGEDMTLDIAGHGFRIPFWHVGLAVVMPVVRPETVQRHMWPPSVVPARKFGGQERQVIKSLDERDMFEPLVLEGLDNAFWDSNGPVFPYGSKAEFDVPLSQQFGKGIPDKDLGLV
jgi:hypothetical protein